jgi:hypothetical protein
MPAPLAHLQGRLDLVFAQVVLELHEVLHGALVISVDGDPLAPLRGRVDGVETDGDFTLDVAPDRL